MTKRKWVDPDDAPSFTGDEIEHPDATWRIGGKMVSPEEGIAAFQGILQRRKTRVNIHLDNDVIAYFKKVAGEQGGYQTLINAALRRTMDDAAAPKAGSDSGIATLLRNVEAALKRSQQVLEEVTRANNVGAKVASVSSTLQFQEFETTTTPSSAHQRPRPGNQTTLSTIFPESGRHVS